jgi:predicted Zn finger-like uncharacterized protein
MQIDCPTCARSYQVAGSAIGATGRMVVCPACETRWHVAPQDDDRHSISTPVFGVIRAEAQARAAHPASRTPTARRRATGAMRALVLGMGGVCLLMLVIGKRTAIVTAAPRSAALYAAIGLPVNIRGLEFADIKTTRLDEGALHLEISGRIRNVADRRTPVPRIAFDIRDARGVTLASWTESAPKRVLADNETVRFTAQATTLPEGYKDVVVRFASDAPHETLLIHKTH